MPVARTDQNLFMSIEVLTSIRCAQMWDKGWECSYVIPELRYPLPTLGGFRQSG